MSIIRAMALKKACASSSKEKVNDLLSRMPHNLADVFLKLPPTTPTEFVDFTKEELLDFVDPSWYEELIDLLAPDDRKLFASIIPSLGNHIPSPYVLSGSLKKYCIDFFFPWIIESIALTKEPKGAKTANFTNTSLEMLPPPVSFLSEDPLLSLIANQKRASFEQLIFFLGLFDLATEIKKIIYKKTLSLIEQALSKEETLFIMHLKKMEKIISIGDMGLSHYNGDKEGLRKVIRERGIFRFAKAVGNSSAGLLWYLLHALPKSTALEIQRFISPIKDPKVETKLKKQIIQTWEWLCTASHS